MHVIKRGHSWLTLIVALFIGFLAALISPVRADGPASAPSTRPARELNVLAMGDWGEGKPAQKKVADTMAGYVRAEHAPFAALLSAGDNFYVPLAGVDDPAWQTLFEKMYDAKTLDFPFYAALGNHDYDQDKYKVELAYAKQHPESRWKMPARWYRVDLPAKKPLLTAIMLDSDHDNLTAAQWARQREWLADELAGPRAAWTICCAHHPLFSNGIASDNGILQHDWGSLFKKYDVDIYLCGHEHNLQHLEIPGWKTSFVLAGGGGAHQHPMIRDNRGPFSRSIYGFVHFDFTPEQVTVRYIGSDGTVLHEFVRTKAGAVRVTKTTPSDPAIDHPLEAIQGIYDKIHGKKEKPDH
ncbi:MAG TPA: metallophosphoesterase [Tepidisphaeraceae bacterium]|nr:metallophosphoesterase [Tepidisphaeraceae bacterium]